MNSHVASRSILLLNILCVRTKSFLSFFFSRAGKYLFINEAYHKPCCCLLAFLKMVDVPFDVMTTCLVSVFQCGLTNELYRGAKMSSLRQVNYLFNKFSISLT